MKHLHKRALSFVVKQNVVPTASFFSQKSFLFVFALSCLRLYNYIFRAMQWKAKDILTDKEKFKAHVLKV